ncbi:MAG TPA: PAS domain S-box protein [Candidatus Eremiobacteraeota bacterium]|nr:MAG: Blue-light-activated protein [bacterium ADurb.Bin363]HPZ09309.1 PAS domain S-box protein [Candidatus Eremiobacteraeota bacterium]
MRRFLTLSLRTYLLLLVILSAFPVIAILFYTGLERRNLAFKNANYSTLQLVRNIAIQEEQITENIRQLLITLSHIPVVQNKNEIEASKILHNLMKENSFYKNIIITDHRGEVWASASNEERFNISQSNYFKEALETKTFSTGEYIKDNIHEKSVVPFAYPISSDGKNIDGVIVIYLNIDLYALSFLQSELPEGSNLILLDPNGIILHYFPSENNYEGKKEMNIIQEKMEGEQEEGTFLKTSLDGVKRLYAYKRLYIKGSKDPYLFIRVGIPAGQALSEVNYILTRNVILLIFSMVITMFLAWIFGNLIIVKRFKKLLLASLKVGLGNLNARTDLTHTEDELGQLAKSFDNMAEALEKRELKRQEVEKSLQKSEEQYRRLVEQAQEGILAFDKHGNITFANPKISNILGYSQKEIIGTNLLDFINEESKGNFEYLKENSSKLFELELKRKDGKKIYTIFSASSVNDEGRNFSDSFAVVMDITERRKYEEELHYRLAVEELVTRLSTRFINITIDEIDREINNSLETIGKFVDVHYCYVNLFSKDLKKIEKSYRWCKEGFIPKSEKSVQNFITDFQLNIKGEKIIWEEFACMADLAIPMVLSQSLIGALGFNKAGEEKTWKKEDIRLLKLVGEIFVNVLERKLATEERRKMEDQIYQSQKLESLGIMAAGIAHDFNNILTGLLGYAELTLLDLPPDSEAQDNIKEIIKSGHRAADITKQILAYTGKGSFVKEKINLSLLSREMEQLVKISISKKCTLKYNLSEDIPSIEGDVTQIRQIIMNLVINSSEAIGDNNGIITLSTGRMVCDPLYLTETYLKENLQGGLYVYLEIEDTGSGMTEEVRNKIFDPFFTTKFVGRGLGMASVLGITKSHKGSIKVYSEAGKGTKIRVLFPVLKSISEETPHKTDEMSNWKGSGTFLVVDDEADIRMIAKAFLKRAGFTVLTACNGQEGLEIFKTRREKISGVLLDMTMPVMDGKETLQELRKIQSDIKVILSSAYSPEEAFRQFKDNGFNAFIQKPYQIKSFLEVIKNHVFS